MNLKGLLALFLVITALDAQARDSRGNRTERDQRVTRATCDGFTWSSERDLCVTLARKLSDEDAKACQDFSPWSDDQSACLTAAASGDIGLEDIQYCATKSFSSDKVACLEAGGVIVKSCDGFTWSSERELCRSLAWNLNDREIKICQDFSPWSDGQSACLKAAATRGVRARDLLFCSAETFDSDKQECLDNIIEQITAEREL